MARKKKTNQELRTSIRLPDDVQAGADRLQEETGWTQTAAIIFLFEFGAAALSNSEERLEQLRRLRAATIEIQKLRNDAAARAIRQVNREVAAIAPPAPGAEPPKKRGRPRKNPDSLTQSGPGSNAADSDART